MLRTIRPRFFRVQRRLARCVSLMQIRRHALPFLIMLLITRTQLIDGLSPFAIALFAAGLNAGRPALPMLLGCLLSVISMGIQGPGLMPVAGCMITWILWRSLHALAPVLHIKKNPVGENGIVSQYAFTAAFAFAGTFAAAFLFSTPTSTPFSAAVAALVALLLAPTMTGCMTLTPNRRLLMPDEQISLLVVMLSVIPGLNTFPVAGPFLARFAVTLATMLAAGQSAGMGALIGISAETVMLLTGQPLMNGVSLGLIGLLAGCARSLSRFSSALAAIAGFVISISLSSSGIPAAGEYIPIAMALITYCALPMRTVKRIWRLIDVHRARRVDPERMAVRFRQGTGNRLTELSVVFQALADGYGEQTAQPDEQALIARMRVNLCEGCPGYAACWGGEAQKASRMLCKLLGDVLSGEAIPHASDVPPELMRKCKRAAQLEKRLGPLLTDFCQQKNAASRRAEYKQLLSRQFRQASSLLDGMSQKLAHPVRLNPELTKLAEAALDREGLCASEVMAVEGDTLSIIAVLNKGIWSSAAAHQAARRLSSELGVTLVPSLTTDDDLSMSELHFCEAPAYAVEVGACSRPMTKDAPCGDSHFYQALSGGQAMLALSDGMGSGERAAQESASAISLISKFMTAGIERPLALNAVNSLMMLKSGDEIFATVDLCMLDLTRGVASFSKLGACASMLIRGGKVTRIEGGHLPLGILEQVKPTSVTIELKEGDLIVMLTDGIADSARPGQEEWLLDYLTAMPSMTPAKMADTLMSAVISRENGKPQDDMTVMVAGIRKSEV